MNTIQINPEKETCRVCRGVTYERWAIKTPVITWEDQLHKEVQVYALPHLRPGDILFLSEKMVACTQGRAYRLEEIQPRRLADLLSRFVSVTPSGTGLSIPETMEMALRECGAPRILLAAFVGMLGKIVGRKGWFYRVAGRKAAAIDGPCSDTLPPYNHCVVLAPLDPDGTARRLSACLNGTSVLIADINDLGGYILGASDPSLDRELFTEILGDNPLGQSCGQTPLGIIRRTDV